MTKEFYSAELESVDFRGNFEAARLNINSWVEDKTQGSLYTYKHMPDVDAEIMQ